MRRFFLMKSSLAVKTGSGGGGSAGVVGGGPPGKPRRTGGVGVSALEKKVGSLVTIRFAPAFTERLSTSSDASEVVTIPVTVAEGSPALKVSTDSGVSGFQSTPMFFLIRSTTSWAVTELPIAPALSTSGAAATPVAVRTTNLLREIGFISS